MVALAARRARARNRSEFLAEKRAEIIGVYPIVKQGKFFAETREAADSFWVGSRSDDRRPTRKRSFIAAL
jgi:hypothetical protein